jgi:hypothetical protein
MAEIYYVSLQKLYPVINKITEGFAYFDNF